MGRLLSPSVSNPLLSSEAISKDLARRFDRAHSADAPYSQRPVTGVPTKNDSLLISHALYLPARERCARAAGPSSSQQPPLILSSSIRAVPPPLPPLPVLSSCRTTWDAYNERLLGQQNHSARTSHSLPSIYQAGFRTGILQPYSFMFLSFSRRLWFKLNPIVRNKPPCIVLKLENILHVTALTSCSQ